MHSQHLSRGDTQVYVDGAYIPNLKSVTCEQTMSIVSESPIHLETTAHRITLEFILFRGINLIDFRQKVYYNVRVITPYISSSYNDCQVLSMITNVSEGKQTFKVVLLAQARVDDK